MYVGLFGQGKTLSAVHDAIQFYKKYNDKKVFDDRINEFVIQKVFVLSNVDIKDIPYRKFHSMQQIINISKWRHITDRKKKVRTITIIVGDEFSVCCNSRQFASNFSPLTLSAILCSRHALIHGFFLTAQRYGQVDALLRQVTNYVIECKKVWRIQKHTWYDAWEYENSPRPTDCRKLDISGFFVTDKDYQAYDTLQVVDQISKATESGDMISQDKQLSRISKSVAFYADKNRKKKKFV